VKQAEEKKEGGAGEKGWWISGPKKDAPPSKESPTNAKKRSKRDNARRGTVSPEWQQGGVNGSTKKIKTKKGNWLGAVEGRTET